jgi:hypothetical protein
MLAFNYTQTAITQRAIKSMVKFLTKCYKVAEGVTAYHKIFFGKCCSAEKTNHHPNSNKPEGTESAMARLFAAMCQRKRWRNLIDKQASSAFANLPPG